jgi:hypothetical protein
VSQRCFRFFYFCTLEDYFPRPPSRDHASGPTYLLDVDNYSVQSESIISFSLGFLYQVRTYKDALVIDRMNCINAPWYIDAVIALEVSGFPLIVEDFAVFSRVCIAHTVRAVFFPRGIVRGIPWNWFYLLRIL